MSGRSIFLSYAHQDRDAVLKLDVALRGRNIAVWRDQDRLRAAQNWPAAIGEAIDEQQALVLVWSRHAAASHFVQLEWTTAYALKKPVLTCRLDDTPLHPSLVARHAVPFERAPDEIVRALEAEPVAADPARRTSVFDALRRIHATPSTPTARMTEGRIPAPMGGVCCVAGPGTAIWRARAPRVATATSRTFAATM